MTIQRIITKGCRLRIVLTALICLITGFVISVTTDSFRMARYAEDLLKAEAMRDTLWLEFAAKKGVSMNGYNSYWIENINSIKDMPGVDGVSVQVSMHASSGNERILAISGRLLSRLNVPLYQGAWTQTDEEDYIPAIISYDLRKSYSPGEACSLRAEGTNAGYALDLNLRVVGVLYEYGGLMNLAVGQYVTNPNLINNLYWNNLKSTLIIPVDALPWSGEIGYDISPVIAVHMTEEYAGSDALRTRLQESLYEKGYGLTNTGDVLANRALRIENANTGRNRLMIQIFLVLMAVGILGYNAVYAYRKGRDFLLLRLLGVTKKRILFHWLAMIAYSCFFPVLIGLMLGQWALTNGETLLPHDSPVPLLCVLAMCALILTMYMFIRRMIRGDIARKLKGDLS